MFREPGYPFFLFLNYKIFGVNVDLVRLEQVILLFLIIFLTYRLAKEIFNEWVANIAALAVAICPLFVIYSGEMISETLAAFLILLFCLVFTKSIKRENAIYSFLAGLVLAALILTKSIFVFIPIIILPTFYRLLTGRKKMARLLLFCLGIIILIFPWLYRNHLYFNKWALAERGGLSMYIHASKSELTQGQLRDYAISALLSQYLVRLGDPSFDVSKINVEPANRLRSELLAKGYSEDRIDNFLIDKSKNLWRQYPLKNLLIGFLELSKANAPTVPRNSIFFVYSVDGSIAWRVARGVAIIVFRSLWLTTLLLAFYGVWRATRLKISLAFPLILFMIYLNTVIFFLEGVPRFIFPIYSLYFIFFAVGAYHLKLQSR